MSGPLLPASGDSSRPARDAWAVFRRTPARLRLFLTAVGIAAVVLPWAAPAPVTEYRSGWVTVLALVVVSVLNVELSRWLSGGLARNQQPHKALSAWAFATGLLLPTAWLLVVVPVTYAHAWWRGLRVPLWKWIGSGFYLVLGGYAAAWVRYGVLGEESNWMAGDGGRGLTALVVAALAFLAVETVLFTGSAVLNDAEDEVWLRAMLTGPAFYFTESGVLLLGGLLTAVWTGGVWYTLLFLPLYVLVQHAVLLGPLRERAAVAGELAAKNAELAKSNAELTEAHQFKIDLLGMLGHELGNPLTSVQGFAQLGADAAEAGDVDAARDAFTVVERNAVQMRAVLHDILANVSREGRGLIAMPEECRVRPYLHAAAAGTPAHRQPEIRCAADLVAMVQPGHLDQILANLLSNAEKYAGGAVRLSADKLDGRVLLVVADHGPGVPHEFRGQLFERYSREPASRTVAGAGLGLFISRELARANGGDLYHRDGEPRGTEFVVSLPAGG